MEETINQELVSTKAIEIADKQVKEQSAEAENMLIQAKDMTVINNEQYTNAAEILKRLKAESKRLDADRKSFTKPLDDLKKKIMERYKPVIDKLNFAYTEINNKMMSFEREQERKRIEAQRKLEEEAREKERKEKEKLEKAAKRAEKKGDIDRAEELRETKEQVHEQAGEIQSSISKISGINIRKDWDFVVIDKKQVPEEYKIINEKALRAMAKTTKGTAQIPGVKFIQKDTRVTKI